MPKGQQEALELMENGLAVSMAAISRPWRGRALRTMFSGDIILLMSTALLIPTWHQVSYNP